MPAEGAVVRNALPIQRACHWITDSVSGERTAESDDDVPAQTAWWAWPEIEGMMTMIF
jgi:hypothetical protein